MNRWARLGVLLAGGGLVAAGLELADPGGPWTALALLGGAIAAGELIELRPPLRAPLPISLAYMVVLARAASVDDAIVVLVVALLATFLVRTEPSAAEARIMLFAERLLAGVATVLVYRGLDQALDYPRDRAGVITILVVTAIVPVAVCEVARMVRERKLELSGHGRSADFALVTSAVLMAISDQGLAGVGGMGLWGPAVFTIPLLAAWYSYEHLDEIRRTYDQTIRALGAAPELGGLVTDGHAERVADVSVAIGTELGFSRSDLAHLETAALLHHLGQVCLDEPEEGRWPEPVAVAESGAAILRSTALLSPAGDIVAAGAVPYREHPGARPASLAGQILKVCSAFDELAGGRAERSSAAIEALYSGPGYLYDQKVLGALEVVLDRRGLLESDLEH
jgi:hypothetical protein